MYPQYNNIIKRKKRRERKEMSPNFRRWISKWLSD
jgi:hypothetical protein